MTLLRLCNTFLIVLTVSTGLGMLIHSVFEQVFFNTLLMLGIFQASTGIVLFIRYPKHLGYQLYMGGLALFALLSMSSWLWIIPILPLTLYYSFLLHINSQSVYT